MELKIFSFDDKTPKRGKVVCFDENGGSAAFYLLTNDGWVVNVGPCYESEWCCEVECLQSYGGYTHWARIDKVFNVTIEKPKD